MLWILLGYWNVSEHYLVIGHNLNIAQGCQWLKIVLLQVQQCGVCRLPWFWNVWERKNCSRLPSAHDPPLNLILRIGFLPVELHNWQATGGAAKTSWRQIASRTTFANSTFTSLAPLDCASMNWRHEQCSRNITGRSCLTFLNIINASGSSHWVKFIEEEDHGHAVGNQTKVYIHIRCILRSWAIGQLGILEIYFCWFSNQEGQVQSKISEQDLHSVHSFTDIEIVSWQIGWNQSALRKLPKLNTIFSKLGQSWNVLLVISDLR